MIEQFVILLRGEDPEGSVRQLKNLVPEASIVNRTGDRLLINCPIYCEDILIDYFGSDGHTISVNRKYKTAS